MLPRSRLHCFTPFLLLAFLGTGCQKAQPYGLVEGVVTLDGVPLTGIEVVFMPDPEKGTKGRRSTSLVDKEGHYRIASDKGRSGAPVGIHRICIIDLLAPRGPGGGIGPAVAPEEGNLRGGEGAKAIAGAKPGPGMAQPSKPNTRFPTAYGSALETPFRDIEVTEGTQVINLDLKKK
jgi:hypothetical protein